MKKQLIILFMLVSTSFMVNAQKEYKLTKTTGQLKLNINGAIVEGYDGKEIIFISKNAATAEVDERAKGLVPITSSGYTDNTGMGINVKENGQEVTVNNIYKDASDIITIKVPQGIKIAFNNNRSQHYKDIIIRNIKSEIEVSTNYNNIKLENNSGPMNINTINGSVEASFINDIKGPISIISIYDYVDVSLPTNIKGNIELGSNYGKLYAAKEFNIAIDTTEVTKTINKPTVISLTGGKTTSIHTVSGTQINGITSNNVSSNNNVFMQSGEGAVSFGYSYNTGEKIKGKLNGGGISLIFKSNNNNVYLRQK